MVERDAEYQKDVEHVADDIMRRLSAAARGLPWGTKWAQAGKELFTGPYREELRGEIIEALTMAVGPATNEEGFD